MKLILLMVMSIILFSSLCLASANVTILSPINGTTYNTIPIDFNWTINSTLNWAGYSLDGESNITLTEVRCFQETATTATECGGLSTGAYACTGAFSASQPCTNAYDANINTYASADGPNFAASGYIFINYTKPINAKNTSLWQMARNAPTRAYFNYSIPGDCWSQDILQFRVNLTRVFESEEFEEWMVWLTGSCYDGTGWEQIVFTRSSQSLPYSSVIYEEAMWWDVYTLNMTLSPIDGKHNLTLYANNTDGDLDFDYVEFTIDAGALIKIGDRVVYNASVDITNTTPDFSSVLNDYLETCTADVNGNCEVILNLTMGFDLTIDSINITYDYNATHSLTRNETYAWNQTKDITSNTKLKRRYAIQPTTDLLSNNLNISGYYLRNDTASQCEINNVARTVTSNYCEILENISRGDSWPTTYIWDNNITDEIAVNMTNTTQRIADTLYYNLTIGYREADNISSATQGTFTNTTLSWNYNTSISQNEKIQVKLSNILYDITPSNKQNCPNYEKKTASSRTFYTCLNRTERYASIKIETSN